MDMMAQSYEPDGTPFGRNYKYSRDGHLFRERFKSEPVNDMAYFVILLRYIHQNPVKAGIVNKVNDYEFSSWHEYEDQNSEG